MLTCAKEERDMINVSGPDTNSAVRKPIDLTQFTDTMREWGLYWLALNEAPPQLGMEP